MPKPEFDRTPAFSSSTQPSSSLSSPSRLDLYLTHLTLRPSNNSPAELFQNFDSVLKKTGEDGFLEQAYLSPSSYLVEASQITNGTDFSTVSHGATGVSSEEASSNPESDSFTYVEMLLESLSILGRLVGALDTVIQRMPSEISSLVDATIDEVSERSEFMQQARSQPAVVGNANSSATPNALESRYVFVEKRQSNDLAFSLRLAALEASSKETDQETLRDLFWTLYSKLDAVLQGFRVTYEVANRIGRVSCRDRIATHMK